MPICRHCRIAYLESETHVCGSESTWPALFFPGHRPILFGTFVGVLWSCVPLVFADMLRPPGQALAALVTGAVVGTLMAAALAWPLRHWPSSTAFWAFLALPIGTFLFGVLVSLFQFGIKHVFEVEYQFARGPATPFGTGVMMIGTLGFGWLGLLLVPFAIWTTYQLKTLIDGNARRDAA